MKSFLCAALLVSFINMSASVSSNVSAKDTSMPAITNVFVDEETNVISVSSAPAIFGKVVKYCRCGNSIRNIRCFKGALFFACSDSMCIEKMEYDYIEYVENSLFGEPFI